MPRYIVEPAVVHKHQTKSNDCWYACIQMLQTWKNASTGGLGKVKPHGHHTMHLHAGLLGHRLSSDFAGSKHYRHILEENSLKCLGCAQVNFVNLATLEGALRRYGPIMVGGEYGELIRHLIKGVGHYIVVAGVDSTNNQILVFDPWHSQPHWMDQNWVADKAWFDDDSQIVCL